MKIKNGFILREISGTYVVIAVGEAAKFNGMISLNSTGAFLWEKLSEDCQDKQTLVNALTKEYEVQEDIASRDVDAFIKKLQEAGVIE